jgi:hypothetical protein
MGRATSEPIPLTSPAEPSMRAAAQAVADPGHVIDAVSLVVPRLDGTARPLMLAAERVASDFGLEVRIRLGGGSADVQFRRPAAAEDR